MSSMNMPSGHAVEYYNTLGTASTTIFSVYSTASKSKISIHSMHAYGIVLGWADRYEGKNSKLSVAGLKVSKTT